MRKYSLFVALIILLICLIAAVYIGTEIVYLIAHEGVSFPAVVILTLAIMVVESAFREIRFALDGLFE